MTKKNKNLNKYNKGLRSIRRIKDFNNVHCLPNEKFDVKTRKRWKKQRKKYGFCDTETYSLDYTAAVWFYEHINMLLDIGGKTVNYNWERPMSQEERQCLLNLGYSPEFYKTDRDVFELILSLLESYDSANCELDEQNESTYYLTKAFKIIAVFLPRMWW